MPPDTPFQEKWMLDVYGKVDTDQSRVYYVAGTTGIILQRVDRQFQSRMEIVF